MRRTGQTSPFRRADGTVLTGSIAESAYRRLGGLDQWVMVRGESILNPPLIMLHGGPGWSETGFFRYFNASLEKSFTVVYWDQRGAGKSFDRAIPRSSMTAEQCISDLDELVDAMRKRLGADKVVIFGHSWGSVLGMLYAARFPDKVAAYVGTGQIGDWPAADAASYAFALSEAERRGNRRAVSKLRAIGPPPHPAKAVFTERTWVTRLDGGMRPVALWKLARAVLGSRESSLIELPDAIRGFKFTMDAMWAEVSRLNLIELAPALAMPVFFLLGRNDHFVPPETSVAYFNALSAPSKRLVWFEHSGHEPFADEPDKFNAAMTHLVRPTLPPELHDVSGQLEAAFPGKYLSLTSYKRNGTGVATPVWFVIDDRRLLVITDPDSFKAKRIRRNPEVTIARCTATGQLRGPTVRAHAELLPDGGRARLDELMARKYSRIARIVLPWIDQMVQRLRRKPVGKPTAVLAITPHDHSSEENCAGVA
jgi:PPOX class probable F420-dependent enzyme